MNATPCGVRRCSIRQPRRPASCLAQLLVGPIRLALFAVLFFSCATLRAQTVTYSGGPVDLGSVNIGSTATSANVTFNIPNGQTASIGGVSAQSFGATLQDFTIAAQTCSGTITGPATCTVKVNFKPVAVGSRNGALTLNASGGTTIVIPIHGIGVGSQLVFSPDSTTVTSTVTPLSPVFYSPTTLVYDGAGNLYFNDILNNRILQQSATGVLSTVLTLPGTIMSSMAISGNGTLYVSVPQQGKVYAIVPGVSSTALTFTGATLSQPSGVAIDGSGNLYVADAQANRIIRSALDGSSATVLPLTGLATPLSAPEGLALDTTGNLFIADTGHQRIVQVALATGAASPVTVTGALFFNFYGLTVDASGTLYVADTSNHRIERIAPGGAAAAILTPNFAFSAPTGVILATNGDLIVADNNTGLVRITRSSPTSPLNFPTPTPVGNLDAADGAKSVTLQNIGNAPLQLTVPSGTNTNPSSSSAAFAATSASTCPLLTSTSTAASGQLASGIVCNYAVAFTPTAIGANTGTLSVVSLPTGAAAPVTQTVLLSGTGLGTVDAFLVTAPATALTGTPVSFTVTARLNGLTGTSYRGTINLTSTDPAAVFLGGTSYTFTAVDAGVHTFTAPANGIRFGTVGTFTITAKDTASASTGTSNPIVVSHGVITPTLTLASSLNPIFISNNTTLTATLTASSGTPTGTITFFDGAVSLGSGAVSNGAASITTSFLATGTHNIVAVYSGDTNFTTATSNTIPEAVEDFSLTPTTRKAVHPPRRIGDVQLHSRSRRRHHVPRTHFAQRLRPAHRRHLHAHADQRSRWVRHSQSCARHQRPRHRASHAAAASLLTLARRLRTHRLRSSIRSAVLTQSSPPLRSAARPARLLRRHHRPHRLPQRHSQRLLRPGSPDVHHHGHRDIRRAHTQRHRHSHRAVTGDHPHEPYSPTRPADPPGATAGHSRRRVSPRPALT